MQPPPLSGAGTSAPTGATPVPGAGIGATAGGTGAPAMGGIGAPAGAGMGGRAAPAPAGGGSVPSGTSGRSAIPPAMGGSWMSYGGDLSHTRASANEKTITAANVPELKTAFDVKAPGVTATPAIYAGVAYWADWGGKVHATNLSDQKSVWDVDRSAMGGGYTGSPFVTEKAVYVANRNGLLSSLDRLTGQKIWEVTINAGVHTHIWSSPVVAEADDVLVLGVGGLGTRDNNVALPRSQLESFRGWVQFVQASTGKLLYRFDVTPEPNGAGVSVWSSAALDTKRKLAFIGTGNNYYTPVSKYSDSLLALDYTTGQLKWHAQFTMGDAWTVGTVLSGGVDGDVGATPNLFSIDGRDVVGVGDKPGRYHVRDRETGAMVWSKPIGSGGGFQGGVMAPAAYQDGVVYVISNNDTRNSTAYALDAKTGEIKWRFNLTDPTFGAPAIGNGVLYVGDQAGNIWALNAMTGERLKQWAVPQGRGGGFSLVDGVLYTGYGFHFSESRREPLMGGLIAYSLTGKVDVTTMTTSMDDCIPDTAVTTAATFTNVYQGVLCPSGCTKVCHSSSAEAMLRLDRKDLAYQGMVDVAAKGEACKSGGHKLVVPGNPNMSLLHGKLAAAPACGVPMPPSATSPANSPITPAMLQAVTAWIAAGAPNN